MTSRHVFQTLVSEQYIDDFGHMNNASYLVLFEEARWDLITTAGYGREKIATTGLGPTILEVNVRFKRELCAGDEIAIVSECHPPQRKVMFIDQQMLRDEVVCAEARFTFGLFDLRQRKLVAPTKEWLSALGLGSELPDAES